MTYQTLNQGIEAVKAGQLQEGARLIRLAMKSNELNAQQRAIGWIWLAETTDNPNTKINYYNEAIQLDASNDYARNAIAYHMANLTPNPPETPQRATGTGTQPIVVPQQTPINPQPPATTHAAPIDYNNVTPSIAPRGAADVVAPHVQSGQPRTGQTGPLYRTVGILGGPTGKGTGFFVTRTGLIATTRSNVGGSSSVNYEVGNGQRGTGQVVRSWAEFDLALIHTGLTINQLLPVSNVPTLADNTPLTVIAHGGKVINGVRRGTKSQAIKPEWFPTNIDKLPDAGGNPVFNGQNMLVGMLTHNANRSAPYVFGLHISTIYQLVEKYAQEVHNNPNVVYCPACGGLSRAASYGGFYCEACGAVLPHAETQERFNLPQIAALYGEAMNRPCPNCQSTVGFYKGSCLRCGYVMPR